MTNVAQKLDQHNEIKENLYSSSSKEKKEFIADDLLGVSMSYPSTTEFIASVLPCEEWTKLKDKPCLVFFKNRLNGLSLAIRVSYNEKENLFDMIPADERMSSLLDVSKEEIEMIYKIDYITYASCL